MTDILKLISYAEKLRPLPAKMSIEDIEAEMRILETIANLRFIGKLDDSISTAEIHQKTRNLLDITLKYFESTTSLKKRSRILLTIYRLATELPLPGNKSKILTDYYRRVDTIYTEWRNNSKHDVATNSYIFCNLVNYFSDINDTTDSHNADPRLNLIHNEASSAVDELTPTAGGGYHWENMDLSVALHRLSFLASYCHGFHITTPPIEYQGALQHYTSTLLSAPTGHLSTIRMQIPLSDILFLTPIHTTGLPLPGTSPQIPPPDPSQPTPSHPTPS
ncbi:MAG: hypothetical protein K2G33_09355, partial [Duncaniella sp.]|nr:hypothetical protein [Duncaniella sp.]